MGGQSLKQSGCEYVQMILDALPINVREFIYSEELSEITAFRDVGTDTWDGKLAMACALED